jgi:hypothetical protein
MGVRVLTKVQYGLEGVHGTAVPADTMLLCNISVPEDDRQVHIPEVMIGRRTNLLLDAAVVRRLVADGMALEDMDGAYFQIFPLLFSCGLLGGVAPAEQTALQADWLWTFAAPQTGAEAINTMTMEIGDNVVQYEIPYCFARSITISADCVSGEVHVSADMVGQFVAQSTITPALAVPSVEMCIGKLSTVSVDTLWANLGTTPLTNALVNWSVTINTGAHPKFWGGASHKFSGHEQGAVSGEATFTLERNALVAAEELLFRPAAGGITRTTRCVEIEMLGTQIGTGDVHSLVLDMAGQWTSWSSLGSEEEGNSLDVATLSFGYDITGAQGFQALVTTNVPSI